MLKFCWTFLHFSFLAEAFMCVEVSESTTGRRGYHNLCHTETDEQRFVSSILKLRTVASISARVFPKGAVSSAEQWPNDSVI